MLKFIFRQKSIWLIFIIVLHCTASPSKGEKGTKATTSSKATKSGQPKKEESKTKAEKNNQDDDQLLVNTTCGFVKGVWASTFSTNPKNQAKYRSFKAIPYAEAPTGPLRFKAPEKKKPWPKTHVTTDKYGACCLETPLNENSKKNRDENCLFLNIFTPADIPENEKLPVLFFIHGGGMCQGCGDDKYYGPDPFMEKNRGVIVVTINYRLGVFGFLAIDKEISGNAAFKDQYMALRWIYDNINEFGGDKKRITVFGQSAGGRSVAHQTLYPQSREIIERALIMSGIVNKPAKFHSSIFHPHVFYDIFPDKFKTEADRSASKLREFLVKVKAKDLQEKLPTIGYYPGLGEIQIWEPVIEIGNATNAFISEHPDETYKKGKIDVEAMFGYNTREYLTPVTLGEFDMFVDLFSSRAMNIPLLTRELNKSCGHEYRKILDKADEKVLKLYWPDKPIDKSPESYATFNKLFSDTRTSHSIYKGAKIHAASTERNTFLYVFDVDLLLNYVKMERKAAGIAGATHSEEIPYLFLSNALKEIYKKASKSTDPKSVQTMAAREFFLEFILEFAKTGFKNATDKYKPIKADKTNAIEISNTGIKPIVASKNELFQILDTLEKDVSKWIID